MPRGAPVQYERSKFPILLIPRAACGTALLASLALIGSTHAALDGYWPVSETTGTVVDNTVLGGTDATLFNGATFFTDPTRGQVLAFDGIDGYADAGTIAQLTLTNNFTWSFWVLNEMDLTPPGDNSLILGNRYDSNGGEFSPREFTKFTPTKFEYHRNTVGQNLEYADFVNPGPWTHVSVVKQGDDSDAEDYSEESLRDREYWKIELPNFRWRGDVLGRWNHGNNNPGVEVRHPAQSQSVHFRNNHSCAASSEHR